MKVLKGTALVSGGTVAGAGFGAIHAKKDTTAKFNAFNKKENSIIGQKAYGMGVRDGAQKAFAYFQKRASDDGFIDACFEKEAKMDISKMKSAFKKKFGKVPTKKEVMQFGGGALTSGALITAAGINYNKKENSEMIDTFKSYNRKENRILGSMAYRKGYQDAAKRLSS